ncbi:MULTISPECIES: restriction endonuclease [Rhodopirellula]|jgi:type III restriction enzyme|uniref:Type III restriction enzyme domain-containing protein n=3 Tax=Rhodopirellula baltica TaxID=265606 RepID=F2AQT9_RHOBT|nr:MULTISPECIES: hypothetical protein [Rhodopirellula]MAP07521.1 restriction endonuclease [Rhodopirellula sp.]MCR9209373.1 restriction endonuclease [bacterium]EGF27993.1 type III restriction enzyme domain-containing protein [Rhodopirellula baltica WH47]EKJ99594.1 type III restriction enzyme domain-containing protein [Rhodopirellula baltica SH28]ELP30065.1 hypothetical protein RBSWK_06153 [Rhodopirellula baltica SWK14]|tara:strand:- start:52791 stop:53051 length:261 start_codon:yes stop_codon:yes gene_type:complete
MNEVIAIDGHARQNSRLRYRSPVVNYNPDWAGAFEQSSVKHVFFIAETKGIMSTLELKKIESAKITGDNVRYDVVDSYDQLMTPVR